MGLYRRAPRQDQAAASPAAVSTDPVWEPIGGITLETYAGVTRAAASRGISDAEGICIFAASQGHDQDSFRWAMEGWGARMRESMAVRQQFIHLYALG